MKKLNLLAGLKAEVWTLIKNSPVFSPNIRLSYQPIPDFTIWTAASKSYTTTGFIIKEAWLKQAEFPPASVFFYRQ